MTEAVIVSTARTGLAKSWKGALNMTYGPRWAAMPCSTPWRALGIDPAEVEDVIMGGTSAKAPPAATSPARSPCVPACPSPPQA